MDTEQLALYNRAGELAHLFLEARRRRLKEPGPDRPWFFHPIGYEVDTGLNNAPPEYDRPDSKLDVRTAVFARKVGALARTTNIWQDDEAMRIAREYLPAYIDYESRRLTDNDMKDVPMPVKPDKKEGIIREAEWRRQWKLYNEQYSGIQTDHTIRLLLKWFKEDFFQWLNSPICINCKTEIRKRIVVAATEEEKRYCARDVELWQCTHCEYNERFPRYNDPIKLLSTRRGRCGEFANCFSLLVRATGVPTRWVWNSEDHVWVEYFSIRQNRWIHLDPCENSYDDPLLYARNWRKKMAYCIAFDEYGAVDVTRRYVRRPDEEGIPRVFLKEGHIPLIMQVLRNIRRTSLTMVEIKALEKRDSDEELELAKYIEDENEAKAAAGNVTPTREGTIGRQTGTAEWKAARGEDGTRG